jgi:hypothetical protein
VSGEVIAVYYEILMEQTNKNVQSLYVYTGGIYTYYCSLIGHILSLLSIQCPINAVVHCCVTQPRSAVHGGVETSDFGSVLSR